MSTALADPAAMINKGAPHIIHSDEQLAEYTKALFELTAKSNPAPQEEEAIELLTLLIERYEAEHHPLPDADPVDVLRFLLDQNRLSQRDIAAELGGESTVSLVLSGKRRLNRDHIERLSRRFHVSPSVFFGKAQGNIRGGQRTGKTQSSLATAKETTRRSGPKATYVK
jgi:HTH-type transcriptional regulator / antitoxin HigA